MPSFVRRGLLCLTIAALTAASVGCAGGSGASGGGSTASKPRSKPTGLLIEPDAAREIGYVVNWAQDLRVRDRLTHARVLGDVIVTVQQPSNLVTGVSARNGEVLWSRIVGTDSDRLRAPAGAADQVLIATDDRLYKLRALDGDLLGVDALEGITTGAPLVVGNTAVFGTLDGTVIGHDLAAGYPRWNYKLTGEALVPPVQVGDNALATDANGVYTLIDPNDGSFVWRGRTFGPISAPAASDRTNVYIPSQDQTLYALNRVTGDNAWLSPYRATQPLLLPPAAYDTVVLLPLPGNGVVALEAADGKPRWTIDTRGLPIAHRGDNALLASRNAFWLVRLDDGQVVAQADCLPLKDALAGPDGSLILVNPKGRLLRINPAK